MTTQSSDDSLNDLTAMLDNFSHELEKFVGVDVPLDTSSHASPVKSESMEMSREENTAAEIERDGSNSADDNFLEFTSLNTITKAFTENEMVQAFITSMSTDTGLSNNTFNEGIDDTQINANAVDASGDKNAQSNSWSSWATNGLDMFASSLALNTTTTLTSIAASARAQTSKIGLNQENDTFDRLNDNPSFNEIVVQSKSAIKVPYFLPKHRRIVWKICVHSFDINFSVNLRVMQDAGSVETDTISKLRKVSSSLGLICEGREAEDYDRQIVLCFDNSYSKLRSKRVCYEVQSGEQLELPAPCEDYFAVLPLSSDDDRIDVDDDEDDEQAAEHLQIQNENEAALTETTSVPHDDTHKDLPAAPALAPTPAASFVSMFASVLSSAQAAVSGALLSNAQSLLEVITVADTDMGTGTDTIDADCADKEDQLHLHDEVLVEVPRERESVNDGSDKHESTGLEPPSLTQSEAAVSEATHGTDIQLEQPCDQAAICSDEVSNSSSGRNEDTTVTSAGETHAAVTPLASEQLPVSEQQDESSSAVSSSALEQEQAQGWSDESQVGVPVAQTIESAAVKAVVISEEEADTGHTLHHPEMNQNSVELTNVAAEVTHITGEQLESGEDLSTHEGQDQPLNKDDSDCEVLFKETSIVDEANI